MEMRRRILTFSIGAIILAGPEERYQVKLISSRLEECNFRRELHASAVSLSSADCLSMLLKFGLAHAAVLHLGHPLPSLFPSALPAFLSCLHSSRAAIVLVAFALSVAILFSVRRGLEVRWESSCSCFLISVVLISGSRLPSPRLSCQFSSSTRVPAHLFYICRIALISPLVFVHIRNFVFLIRPLPPDG